MNVFARFLAGISIGVAATVGCYAFAATTASRLAATFAPGEGAHRGRMDDFQLRIHEKDNRFARLGRSP